MLARAATGQQKDGAIGAADNQEKHNAGKKKLQGMANILPESPEDGLQREMPVLVEALGMLFRKVPRQGLKRGVGGGRCNVGPELDPRYVLNVRNIVN